MLYILYCSNTLPIGHSATVVQPDDVQVCNQSISFQQTVTVEVPIRSVTAENTLQLSQAVGGCIFELSASNVLDLSQQLVKFKEGIASNFLTLTQTTRTSFWESVSHTLDLQQSIELGRGLAHTLTFSQSVSVLKVKTEAVVQTISFVSSVSVYKQNNPDFVL